MARALVAVCLAFFATVIGLGVGNARAEDAVQGKPLRVAVKPIAPFVFKNGKEFTGFSIDLWHAVAQSLKVDTAWVEVATVGDQLRAVETGRADAAIAAITITKEREAVIDWATLGAIFSAFVTVMFVMANILWFVERPTSEHFRKGYLKGIGEGLWEVALIVATGEHGDRQTVRVIKRVIIFFLWLLGVVLIAQLTATITSTQTVDRLSSKIRGPADLPGKKIATVRGTVAADYLSEQGLQYVEVASAEDGSDLVANGGVQAMVFDAPTLQYLSARRGNGVLQVVGPIFAAQKYGIAVPDGSPLRKQINKALLEMYEDGRYKTLYDKWFSREY